MSNLESGCSSRNAPYAIARPAYPLIRELQRVIGRRGWGWWAALVMALIMVPACASPPIPTEPTVESLRTSYRQLSELVRAGQMTPEQAREKYYQKLNDVAANLPGLAALIAFRQKVAEEVATGQLTAEEAHARLTARESDLLDRWEKMAAEYAAEQRRVEQQHNQYEQGYDRQMRIEQGSGIRNLPPNTPR